MLGHVVCIGCGQNFTCEDVKIWSKPARCDRCFSMVAPILSRKLKLSKDHYKQGRVR